MATTFNACTKRRLPTATASVGLIASGQWVSLIVADEHPARCLRQTQNNLGSGARRGAASRRLGTGIKPSRRARKLDHFGDVPA
jgi:hypothetical protein